MNTILQSIRISLSLVALTLLIFLLANLLGFVPDLSHSNAKQRVKLTETLAIVVAKAIQNNNLVIMPSILEEIALKNPEIVSILAEGLDGHIIAKYGDGSGATLSLDVIELPIFKNSKILATLQIEYTSFTKNYIFGIFEPEFFKLVVFVALFGFIVYLVLISKVLYHLDPYKVIPGRVRKALNALTEGVVLIDNSESIVLSNKAFENRTGTESEYLIGKKLSSLSWFYPDTNNKDVFPWRKALINGVSSDHIKLCYGSNHEQKTSFILNCTPLKDEAGAIKGALIGFSDVTELEKMNMDLEAMAQFLRHEINNALVGAAGTVMLLEQEANITDDGKELLEMTQRSHGVIKHLLESMQEAKSIKNSFSNEELLPIRIIDVVRESVKQYSGVYQNNTFRFESDDSGMIVLAREERIMQMLDKLCTNAIEHCTNDTEIVFSCKQNNNKAVILVKNQGALLPADKDKIFYLFSSSQKNNNNSHNEGIGLYVVKLIAEAYGGSVQAKDRRDVQGAEFSIELPINNS